MQVPKRDFYREALATHLRKTCPIDRARHFPESCFPDCIRGANEDRLTDPTTAPEPPDVYRQRGCEGCPLHAPEGEPDRGQTFPKRDVPNTAPGSTRGLLYNLFRRSGTYCSVNGP